jgi:guanylate kinase
MSPEVEPQFLIDEIRTGLERALPRYSAGTHSQIGVSNKEFTGVVGPFGIGKTVITTESTRLEPRLRPINTKTTRKHKDEDPKGFITGVSFTEFRDDVNAGNFINYSIIPGGDAYGTLPEGFTSEYNIGPLLPSSINHIVNAGFRDYHFVYLIAPGNMWREYVQKSRLHLNPTTFRNRLLETLDSIDIAERNMDLFNFVESLNEPDNAGISKAAEKIIDITFRRSHSILHPDTVRGYLSEMSTAANDMLEAA